MKRNKILTIILISLAIILFLAFTVYSFVKETQKKSLPILGQVLDLTLTNDKGEPYRLRSLTGKVWVADFFFTTCSDICPMMTKHMAALSRSFEQINKIRLVSITVNPEYDTANVLAEYAKKQNATDKWLFLTGERQQITDLVVKSFKLGSMDEPIFHSSYFSLVDKHGLIRGYYDGTKQEEINRLFKDAASLIKEKN
ncbi:MAG TPA: SCO family protein [Candidatus Omnitrophota bacterium]|nr:SCO family protein [Candidatus Omnitrophota bacterium]